MAKKSKPNLISQRGLFDVSPNNETIEEVITGQTSTEATTDSQRKEILSAGSSNQSPSSATPDREIMCPKCGGRSAKSMKGGEFIGVYYCVGACSYGDNFYFKPEENQP